MPLVTFSSDSLPASLDDSARFKTWRDRYNEAHGLLEINRTEDQPFSLRFTFTPYGELGVGQFDGTDQQCGAYGASRGRSIRTTHSVSFSIAARIE